MPDTQFPIQGYQWSVVSEQDSQFPFAISMDTVSSSTLPASFRKSKARTPESLKEEKKKPALGKFGNFFTTGRRKSPKNTLEDSLRPRVTSEESAPSPHKALAPLASLDIEEDLSKSEESLVDQADDPNQSRTQYTTEDPEEYLCNKDLAHLYNDIVSEWNTKRVSSDSECSPDWHSSNETIKNTLFDSSVTLQTLGTESELFNDTTNTTTPDFFKSLTNISGEDLEHDVLNHKQLVDAHSVAGSDYVASEDRTSKLESKAPDPVYPSRVLTVDIFLRRAEQRNSENLVKNISDGNHSSTDTMDKKSAARRSGKKRKPHSSGDVPNGERNMTENAGKEEPALDGGLSDTGVEKTNISERKVKASPQVNSPTSNHDIRAGAVSNHKGVAKTELEKNKQQASPSSPYRRKSLRKNLTDAGPLSPTSPKSQGKETSSRRQSEGAMDGHSGSKASSVDKSSSGERTGEVSKVLSTDPVGNSTLPLSEGRTDSKASHFAHTLDGSVLLHTDEHKKDEIKTVSEKQRFSGLDSDKERSVSFDDSRTVTTKFSLPPKPKNIELNLKASKSLEDLGSTQDSIDKAVKINFSIANKISLFENKNINQNQSAEATASKKPPVSNTFVGRAKLKFGKQHTESEQTNRVTNKANSHQKALQNGTKAKEIPSDTKIKSERRAQSSVLMNEEAGKAAESELNQNVKIGDNQGNILTSKNDNAELTEENWLPKTAPVQQREETESFQNRNGTMQSRSISSESGEKDSLNTNASSLRKEKKHLLELDVAPKISDLEHSVTPQTKKEEKGVANAVLENVEFFEQKIGGPQEGPGGACNGPNAGSGEAICESPSDMAKFTETLKNTSACIPQKKKKAKVPRSPAPHFAMPPIHEDNLEKIFDPNVFTVGLGVKRDKPQDLAPSLQMKLQSLETEARVRPKRASAENSIILQSLKLSSRADPVAAQERSGKESKDTTDGEIKRSRLENSAIFSSLLSKEKVFTPSVTSINTITTSFASEKGVDSSGMPTLIFDMAQKPECFSGFSAANYMEKYLQTDDAKKERILQIPNFENIDTNFSNWFKPNLYEPNGFLDAEVFSGNGQSKINPRPGKIVICNKPDPSESTIEVFHDVLDCTSWVLSPVILVKIIRGCWILYEKPNFEGPSIPLEEGELELTNLWGEQPTDSQDDCRSLEPATIGSIRHVVKDYRLCRIDLFTEPEGLGVMNSYFDDTEETRFVSTQKTCSIQVHWGIWLLYEEPGFQGTPLMLEPGQYPSLSFWNKKEAYIRSLKPLKMGARKVEFPENPKVIVYEKPFFEGKHVELDSGLVALAEEGNQTEESIEVGKGLLTSIGSIKVKGGIWVAYEKPEFEGHQYLLEEGEYQEWMEWGGYDEKVQSLRPVLGNFAQPHMIMYAEKDFGAKGCNINVLGIIPNLKDTGYGLRTQSINVLSGVWVAYENPDFTGEQYILDKGMYPSYEAWGALNCKVSSVQPIILDIASDHTGKCKVQLFSEPDFQGDSQIFEKDISQTEDTFLVKSLKVLSGSWIAYDTENFSGNQYVLEEGPYPDLSAMGCLPHTCLKSLRVINVELSEPVIAVFEKENFRGKKMEFTKEVINLRFLGYNPHVASIEVLGGIWIIYEHNNYKGRQILLSPKKIPNWYETSGYHKIGSLRPLLQKRVYFKFRNKGTGKFMSTDGNLDDLNLLRIQVTEDTKSEDQIWVYQDGFIKSRVAEDFCLTIVGNLITPGAKLGLAVQQNEEKQKWTINPDGKIYSKMKPNLVLDVKGGKHYDQNHVIVSSDSEDKPTQCWEALVV
ncbi:hypothetical protein JRQ81_007073 [Phrynocephalus forsythii]|uniref:Beta/gamma crystallin 'Greek key' domain-containing protein n=1 Tax=Phrynocephalus forsythii TaxID=171643 RepID=A0A9Q0Y3N4_9SAUR|nr:hypothetical protein JRQ81_007073 [Phrynocephalus forsythii]